MLEVGCGYGWLRKLPNYLGLDFSLEALTQSGLAEFLFADVREHIPLPDKCFDAVVSVNVLMHIDEERIGRAVSEICRVAKKCTILQEARGRNKFHCFDHDYEELFKSFEGKVLMV